jgi:hypothetical protein
MTVRSRMNVKVGDSAAGTAPERSRHVAWRRSELLTGHGRRASRHGRYRSSVRGSFPIGSTGGDSLG